MLVYFDDAELEYFYTTPLEDIKGKTGYSKTILKQFKKGIQLMVAAEKPSDLRQFRSLKFESLKGDRKGQYSIRLNDQYRLLFRNITAKEVAVSIIEISKHYE